MDYWILKTDYDNYSYVYGCDEKNADGTCQNAHGWVWGREGNLSTQHLQLIDGFIQASCLKPEDFINISQNLGTKFIWI